MTEDDAKTKWCPFARFKFATTSDAPASNREGGPRDDGTADNPWLVKGTRCLGSACMAWRETPTESVEKARSYLADGGKVSAFKALREEFPDVGVEEAIDIINGVHPWPTESAQGFCGLAGKP